LEKNQKPSINIFFQGAECNFPSFINVAKNVFISTTNCSIFLSLYVTEFAIGHSLRTVRATREKLLLAPFVDDSLSSQGFFFSAPNECVRGGSFCASWGDKKPALAFPPKSVNPEALY
jgi:hypothetical protein